MMSSMDNNKITTTITQLSSVESKESTINQTTETALLSTIKTDDITDHSLVNKDTSTEIISQNAKAAEKTLAMIKPNAMPKKHAIIELIRQNGFKIVQEQEMHLSKDIVSIFYQEHYGKPFYQSLVEWISSEPVYLMVLEKESAVQSWRDLMGPTDSNKARESQPTSIRALFGIDGSHNAVHGSDSVNSAEREISLLFQSTITLDQQVESVLVAVKESTLSNRHQTTSSGGNKDITEVAHSDSVNKEGVLPMAGVPTKKEPIELTVSIQPADTASAKIAETIIVEDCTKIANETPSTEQNTTQSVADEFRVTHVEKTNVEHEGVFKVTESVNESSETKVTEVTVTSSPIQMISMDKPIKTEVTQVNIAAEFVIPTKHETSVHMDTVTTEHSATTVQRTLHSHAEHEKTASAEHKNIPAQTEVKVSQVVAETKEYYNYPPVTNSLRAPQFLHMSLSTSMSTDLQPAVIHTESILLSDYEDSSDVEDTRDHIETAYVQSTPLSLEVKTQPVQDQEHEVQICVTEASNEKSGTTPEHKTVASIETVQVSSEQKPLITINQETIPVQINIHEVNKTVPALLAKEVQEPKSADKTPEVKEVTKETTSELPLEKVPEQKPTKNATEVNIVVSEVPIEKVKESKPTDVKDTAVTEKPAEKVEEHKPAEEVKTAVSEKSAEKPEEHTPTKVEETKEVKAVLTEQPIEKAKEHASAEVEEVAEVKIIVTEKPIEKKEEHKSTEVKEVAEVKVAVTEQPIEKAKEHASTEAKDVAEVKIAVTEKPIEEKEEHKSTEIKEVAEVKVVATEKPIEKEEEHKSTEVKEVAEVKVVVTEKPIEKEEEQKATEVKEVAEVKVVVTEKPIEKEEEHASTEVKEVAEVKAVVTEKPVAKIIDNVKIIPAQANSFEARRGLFGAPAKKTHEYKPAEKGPISSQVSSFEARKALFGSSVEKAQEQKPIDKIVDKFKVIPSQMNAIESKKALFSFPPKKVQEQKPAEQIVENQVADVKEDAIIAQDSHQTIITQEINQTIITQEINQTIITQEIKQPIIAQEIHQTIVPQEPISEIKVAEIKIDTPTEVTEVKVTEITQDISALVEDDKVTEDVQVIAEQKPKVIVAELPEVEVTHLCKDEVDDAVNVSEITLTTTVDVEVQNDVVDAPEVYEVGMTSLINEHEEETEIKQDDKCESSVSENDVIDISRDKENNEGNEVTHETVSVSVSNESIEEAKNAHSDQSSATSHEEIKQAKGPSKNSNIKVSVNKELKTKSPPDSHKGRKTTTEKKPVKSGVQEKTRQPRVPRVATLTKKAPVPSVEKKAEEPKKEIKKVSARSLVSRLTAPTAASARKKIADEPVKVEVKKTVRKTAGARIAHPPATTTTEETPKKRIAHRTSPPISSTLPKKPVTHTTKRTTEPIVKNEIPVKAKKEVPERVKKPVVTATRRQPAATQAHGASSLPKVTKADDKKLVKRRVKKTETPAAEPIKRRTPAKKVNTNTEVTTVPAVESETTPVEESTVSAVDTSSGISIDSAVETTISTTDNELMPQTENSKESYNSYTSESVMSEEMISGEEVMSHVSSSSMEVVEDDVEEEEEEEEDNKTVTLSDKEEPAIAEEEDQIETLSEEETTVVESNEAKESRPVVAEIASIRSRFESLQVNNGNPMGLKDLRSKSPNRIADMINRFTK